MFRSVKNVLVLLVAAMTAQLSPNGAQATTVSELLNAMQQRQLSIQDYDFVVMRSFFFDALEESDVETVIQKRQELFNRFIDPTIEDVEQRALVDEISRTGYVRSGFTGALLQSKGIGLNTRSYAIYLFPDPQTLQLTKFLNATPEERESNLDLYTKLKPKMELAQYKLVIPECAIDSVHINTQDGSETGLFELPPQSTMMIEDSYPDFYRYSVFPFWHEEALRYATADNTTIVSESNDGFELLITPDDAPHDFAFILHCNTEGRVHRYIKKVEGQTFLEADYLHFVAMKPEGIEIPQVGRMWMPARIQESARSVNPRRETTRISTLILGEINAGLTLDELAIEAPTGTTIVDNRSTDLDVTTVILTDERRITTTRPVRLGANLPDDIRELNLEDE